MAVAVVVHAVADFDPLAVRNAITVQVVPFVDLAVAVVVDIIAGFVRIRIHVRIIVIAIFVVLRIATLNFAPLLGLECVTKIVTVKISIVNDAIYSVGICYPIAVVVYVVTDFHRTRIDVFVVVVAVVIVVHVLRRWIATSLGGCDSRAISILVIVQVIIQLHVFIHEMIAVVVDEIACLVRVRVDIGVVVVTISLQIRVSVTIRVLYVGRVQVGLLASGSEHHGDRNPELCHPPE